MTAIYSYDEIKAAADCVAYMTERLGLRPSSRNGEWTRFNCPWKADSDSGAFAVSRKGWAYHVTNEKGSIIDLCARARHGGDIWKAQAELGEWLNLTPKQHAKAKRKIVATYDYTDPLGIVLFQVVRFEPKDFQQRRPDPDKSGEWLWSMEGIERVPFLLPDWHDSPSVTILEGEKDALSLKAMEIAATTLRGGAGKWDAASDLAKWFKDKIVTIWPDADAAGAAHRAMLIERLFPVAKEIRVVEKTPGLFKDVSAWIAGGATPEQVRETIAGAALYEGIPETELKELPIDSDFYYDRFRKEYVMENSRNVWLSLNEAQFKKNLQQKGFSVKVAKGETLSPADEKILEIRDKHHVDYVGALAGHDAGLYTLPDQQRILVTKSPVLPEPVEGDWYMLEKIIDHMLYDDVHDQNAYFYGWLKTAYESLRARKLRPGQALVFAGPRDCGKSLFIDIITHILGGRSAKPYAFMTEKSSFNSDWFGAESLVIDDESASTDIRARRSFGAQLKQICAANAQRCHPKFRDAFMLYPFWRLSIAINDEPENLMVLPPIDDSIEDKIIILKTDHVDMPMPTARPDDRKRFWHALEQQIPAFLYYLTKQHVIKPEHESQRYGVTHFQHPDILFEIDMVSPENRLHGIIQNALAATSTSTQWIGSAEELESELGKNPNYGYEAKKLFTWANACGTYLGRLARKHPDTYTSKRTAHHRVWTIRL